MYSLRIEKKRKFYKGLKNYVKDEAFKTKVQRKGAFKQRYHSTIEFFLAFL